ncbi:MAG: type II toxin-antitoxin system VapC family toxin [Myxococcota bacterium]
MRLVLDASVAVAAARAREPLHRAAQGRVARILRGEDELIVPTIFSVEVAAALARVDEPAAAIRAYVDALLRAAARIVPLGPVVARRARETAMRWRLRAADALYVSVASWENLPLCTLDREMRQRGASACEVITP